MNLLIHDLKTEEWNKIAQNYATNWQIISDNGAIRSCNGCFGCWDKDPGRCVVHDGYENMGYLIHHAEEVVVISKYTYGGFSSFVKNVFDRSLGYLLPHFEVINVHHNRESHHKKRYDESKPFTFIFYGHDINEEQKQNAGRYVDAVCTNARGKIKDLIFSSTSNYASASRMEKVGYVKKNENDSFSNKPVITNNIIWYPTTFNYLRSIVLTVATPVIKIGIFRISSCNPRKCISSCFFTIISMITSFSWHIT